METLQHFADQHSRFQGWRRARDWLELSISTEWMKRPLRVRGLNLQGSAGEARGGNSFWVTEACRIDYSIKTRV